MRRVFSGLALLLMGGATSAAAAVATFDYVAIGNGGTVTGTFGWDLSVPDSNSVNDFLGGYPAAGFLTGTITGGPQDGGDFSVSGMLVLTQNAPAPNYGITLQAGGTWSNLSGPTNGLGDALPTQLDLSLFTSGALFVASADISTVGPQYLYAFSSVTTPGAEVPVPASLPLLAAGLGALGFARRRMQ